MMDQYAFTTDWFGGHIPVWQSYLSHLAGVPSIRFLEIGCFEGRATIWLLGNILTHETARIDCIDPFILLGAENNFDHNVKVALAEHKVRKIRGCSQEIARGLPLNHYDAIYIDGSHIASDVLEDAILAFRLLKPGGIMIFDDYEWNWYNDPQLQPKMAIDAFLNVYQRKYELLHKAYQVLIRKLP